MTNKRKKTIHKKKISKEGWSLDYRFLQWLEEHLVVYLKDASVVVDLEYYHFFYKDKEYTQKEIIERMITILHEVLPLDWWDPTYGEKVNEILDLWKLVFPAMWW